MEDFNSREISDFDEDFYLMTSVDFEDNWTSHPSFRESREPISKENNSKNRPRSRSRNRNKSFLSEVMILKKFLKGTKDPKKEYVRCNLIRGHKRAIRQVFVNKIPSATIHKIDTSSSVQTENWLKFAFQVKSNEIILKAKSQTTEGPITDGKTKRKASNINNEILKSFNDTFCRDYFNSEVVVESFVKYLAIIFSSMDPESLIERFKFRCCRNEENGSHNDECKENWIELRKYLEETMIQELKIKQEPEILQIREEYKVDFI